MENTFIFNPYRQRLLSACKDRVKKPTPSIGKRSVQYGMSQSTLQRAVKLSPTVQITLQMRNRRGTTIRLDESEEKIIAETAYEFQKYGTPLTRDLVLDLASTPIRSLPVYRRKQMGFKGDRSDLCWLRGLIVRHRNLSVKTSVDHENERVDAMSPHNVAQHFARIRYLLNKYDIQDPTKVFNIDECGFSVKGMTWGRRIKRVIE